MNSTNATTIPQSYWGQYGIWGNAPSEGLAIAALCIFIILAGILLFQIIKHRTWYLVPLVVACAMEIFSFAFRLHVSISGDYFSLFKYIAASTPLILAPTVVAMGDYALVSKM